MSKEELLKYLIAEIDLIMHDKDYRFENDNDTWYSRESCRDLTNEEVFEELRAELRQIADLEAKLAEAQKPKEIRFNGFVVDCNYDEARKVLQEDLLKMQAENKKLKESEELSNYAKCISENKKLEEDLELSEKCCAEYEQEVNQLKQQLTEQEKEIEGLKAQRRIYLNRSVEECNKITDLEFELQHKDQDKISFAIEQIVKTKEILIKFLQDEGFYENEWYDLFDKIDNQINELKEGK